jgi:hypothetical protein
MSKEEWAERLDEIIELYNHEPQEGKLCCGRSPEQAYQDFYGNTPLRHFAAHERYLLATHTKEIIVDRRKGISFTLRGETFTYKGEQTGQLIGCKVKAWFDPEHPERCSFTVPELSEYTPFTLEREIKEPPHDAPREVHEAALRQNAAHQAYGDRLYRAVAKMFPEDFQRRMLVEEQVDPDVERLGTEMAAQQNALASTQTARRRKDARGQRQAAQLGMILPRHCNSQNLEAVDRLKEFLAPEKTEEAVMQRQGEGL